MLLNPFKEFTAVSEEVYIAITNANPHSKMQFSISHLFCIHFYTQHKGKILSVSPETPSTELLDDL
jgi:hypothetical protein